MMKHLLKRTLLMFIFLCYKCSGKMSKDELRRVYCAITCNGVGHTMCQFQDRSSSCIRYKDSYDPKNAHHMLDDHNAYREFIANGCVEAKHECPKAANMRLMVWDPELATIAHRWLSQCVIGHDDCRNTANAQVGQNIGFLVGEEIEDNTALDFSNVFEKWTQVELVILKNSTTFTSNLSSISSFTQVIWHNTYKVGCSDVMYWKNNTRVRAIACNYAPKGNVLGESIYEQGPPCTNCSDKTFCNATETRPMLCGRKGDAKMPNYELIDSGGKGIILLGEGVQRLRYILPHDEKITISERELEFISFYHDSLLHAS